MSQPNFTKPFVFQMDTSEVGLGAVLLQELDGEEQLVLYLSHKLFIWEMCYSTIEWEALTIKWAVDALRYCQLPGERGCLTDHAPLWWINNMKETNARIMR